MKNKFKVISLVFCCLVSLMFFSACSLSDIGVGLSAYEIAVKNGYQGTEQEWLESLKGDNVQWEKIVSDLEQKLDDAISLLDDADLDTQYASNLAMRSSVKVVANSSAGSGTIINYDEQSQIAHILTCFHVIADETNTQTYASSNIYVQFFGTEDSTIKNSAEFIGGAPYSDIAILKAKISAETWNKYDLRVAKFADSKELGKTAVAVGNAKNKGLNAVKCNISKPCELTTISNITGLYGNTKIRVMRINAILAKGNSGGGVFDVQGNLIGMINSKSPNADEINFSYAIPTSITYGVYANIINQLEADLTLSYALAKKCEIGLNLDVCDISNEYDALTSEYKTIDEVYVKSSSITAIKKDDILYEATINRGSEIIKKIRIENVYDLGDLMWLAKIGDVLTIKYKRGNSVTTTDISITKTISNLYLYRENLKYA